MLSFHWFNTSLVEDLQKRLQEYTDKLEHLGNGFVYRI